MITYEAIIAFFNIGLVVIGVVTFTLLIERHKK